MRKVTEFRRRARPGFLSRGGEILRCNIKSAAAKGKSMNPAVSPDVWMAHSTGTGAPSPRKNSGRCSPSATGCCASCPASCRPIPPSRHVEARWSFADLYTYIFEHPEYCDPTAVVPRLFPHPTAPAWPARLIFTTSIEIAGGQGVRHPRLGSSRRPRSRRDRIPGPRLPWRRHRWRLPAACSPSCPGPAPSSSQPTAPMGAAATAAAPSQRSGSLTAAAWCSAATRTPPASNAAGLMPPTCYAPTSRGGPKDCESATRCCPGGPATTAGDHSRRRRTRPRSPARRPHPGQLHRPAPHRGADDP